MRAHNTQKESNGSFSQRHLQCVFRSVECKDSQNRHGGDHGALGRIHTHPGTHPRKHDVVTKAETEVSKVQASVEEGGVAEQAELSVRCDLLARCRLLKKMKRDLF